MELKIIKMNKNTKKYVVASKNGNDFFEIEAENKSDAALVALNSLGWIIALAKNKKEDHPDQFCFEF